MTNPVPPVVPAPEPGDLWFTPHDQDLITARNAPQHFENWRQLQPYGDEFVRAFLTQPLLRMEYYSLARSHRESGGGQFGEKWCQLIEDTFVGNPTLAIPRGTLQRDDFASFHKYLFWHLASAIYQQTGKQIETFPPHDADPQLLTFHGVPNGDGGGGLRPGGLGVPP